MDSSAQQSLTVAQVAELLDTPAWNVRRWSDYHKAHLSSHTPGQPRRFTEKDVETLRAIATWRAAGLTAAEVNQRLDTLKIGEIVTAPQAETLPAVQEETPTDSTTQLQIRVLFEQVDDLRRRNHDAWVMFGLGFLCCAALFALLLMLFILFGGS